MDRSPLPLRFYLDGPEVSGDTLLGAAGPYVVVLSMTLEDAGIRLHGAYVGHPHREEILVSEFADPGGGPSLRQRQLVDLPGAFSIGRLTLLYDHLARLQELARERGLELRAADASIVAAARALDPLARV